MSTPSPDWVADSKFLQDVFLFGRTVRRVLSGPRAFADDWVNDRTEASNPLTFLTFSLGLFIGFRSLVRWALDVPPEHVAKTIGPFDVVQLAIYGSVILLAAYLHFVALRKSRGERHFQLAVGVTMFAIGAYEITWGPVGQIVVSWPPLPLSTVRYATVGIVGMLIRSVLLALLMAGAYQRKARSMLGWVLSFYVVVSLLIPLGLGLKALANSLPDEAAPPSTSGAATTTDQGTDGSSPRFGP